MASYQNISNYNSLLKEAVKDTVQFTEGEMNAIRGAYRILVCQDDTIYPWQKCVGNHRGEMKFEVQNYTVYLGWNQKHDSMFIDVEHTPGNWINEYHICGYRPIRSIREPGKTISVWKYDWDTGHFMEGQEYQDKIYYSTSDVEEVGEEQFDQQVWQLREKFGSRDVWKCQKEALPSPRIMEAVNRICRINWNQKYEEKLSQVKLFHEYLIRLKRYIKVRDLSGAEELFDLMEQRSHEISNISGYSEKVLSGISNTSNQRVCRWYLEWISYQEQEGRDETRSMNPFVTWNTNPFEPLIYLFERGANFGQQDAALLHYYDSLMHDNSSPETSEDQNITELDYELLEAWDRKQSKFTMQGPRLSYSEIMNAQQNMGRQLPMEYVEFMLLYNGGRPESFDFYNPALDQFDSVGLFYEINPENRYELIWVCQEYRTRMPAELFPIAGVGGCQICMCTAGEHNRKIFLWDSEEEPMEEEQPSYANVYLLADSLVAFLEALK